MPGFDPGIDSVAPIQFGGYGFDCRVKPGHDDGMI
jgi:hypothetical protein